MDELKKEMNKLINQRIQLEKQLQELKRKNIQQLDTEINLSIMRITKEITNLSNRINVIKEQQKQIDLNNVRKVLNVSFDIHIYTIDENSNMIQMTTQTAAQLQIQYFKLTGILDTKLENNEISEETYNIVFDSLTNLYTQYKQEISNKNEDKITYNSNQPQPTVSTSDFGEMIDFIDDDLLQDKRFLEMFKLHNMKDTSVENIKWFIRKYRQNVLGEEDDEEKEIVESIESPKRRM